MTKETFFLLKGTFGRGQLSPELTPSMAFTNEHDDLFFSFPRRPQFDRFACDYNTKLPKFNSRFLKPGTEAVDAFTQD